MSIYDYTVKARKGTTLDMADLKGKVLLIVNTATGCGFTPQYKALEALYEKYHEQGLEILDFPCNQFGHQAPGTEEEIVSFCKGRFGVTFRQFAKINVNGEDESPLYAYLKSQKGGVLGSNIKWNFTKFLVDRDGHVVERYAPTVTPESIENRIKELLK